MKFSPDGRFVQLSQSLNPNDRFVPGFKPQFVDLVTEKSSPEGMYDKFIHGKGWISEDLTTDHNYHEVSQPVLRRLPPPDHLNISPDLLELWVEVAVRGGLNDEGVFTKWNEETWEKHRQELASKPAPYPDFPFPGYVATDRLHWLRKEYEGASEAESPGLAKQLLQKAEDLGEKAETVHWRGVLDKLKK